MNTFGRLFRVSVLGESHGEVVGALCDGVPAGIPLAPEEMLPDLERRRGGRKGTTPRREADIPRIRSGCFRGRTTGAPLLLLFDNTDVDSRTYEALKATPRPGHADLVARQKFGGFNDYRGGGHFSGRLTAALVAAGTVAKKICAPTHAAATLIAAGTGTGPRGIERAIAAAMRAGDSVGGLVECRVTKLPTGLGEPFFDSVESMLSHAVFSIPAVRGIEFGVGFAAARLRGSAHNDAIVTRAGATATNRAGGINGGITNGNALWFRVAVKPTSSIRRAGATVDLASGRRVPISVAGRHDACIALRVPVVVEAVTAMVVADFLLCEQQRGRIAR